MKVLVSASFSVARCSRPICGSARCTTSPSSSSTKRKTPCAAGCCGPKFSVKLRMSAMHRTPISIFAHDARGILPRLDGPGLVNHTRLIRVVAHLDITRDGEVLAERMTNKAVVSQNATQVVVTNESNTIKVECFALKPVCSRPDGRH